MIQTAMKLITQSCTSELSVQPELSTCTKTDSESSTVFFILGDYMNSGSR